MRCDNLSGSSLCVVVTACVISYHYRVQLSASIESVRRASAAAIARESVRGVDENVGDAPPTLCAADAASGVCS